MLRIAAMKRSLTLAEIREMLQRGEVPGAWPGMTFDQMLAESASRAGDMLATLMHVPRARVSFKFLELEGMPGKIGALVGFDPELTDDERELYVSAMHALCAITGSRPPVKAASA